MRRFGPIALAVVFAAGCSGRDGVRDAGDAVRGLVRVDLSYTHTAGMLPGDARFDAQARFVRYRSFDADSVPTILGFADFDGVPLDGCRVFDGTAELDSALAADSVAPTAEVALLDAGNLELRGPIDRAALTRRAIIPSWCRSSAASSTAATSCARSRSALGQPYQVTGEGGNEVGPFSAAVTAPRSFPSLTVDALRRGSDLDVRWSTEGSAAARRAAGARGALVVARRRHAHGALPRARRRRASAFRTTRSPTCRRRARSRRRR